MAPHLGRIFAAGIVWDPREPLPPEFRGASRKLRERLSLGQQNDDGHDLEDGFNRQGRRPTADAHATWTSRPQVLPRDIAQFSNHARINAVSSTTPGKLSKKVAQHPEPVPAQAPQEKDIPAFTVQESDRNVLPPLSISLDASIVQDTARVAVTQTFWNDCSRPIKEASYTFPLPTGCTVTDFSCRIGTNKIIKGNVRPKQEAREAFDRHIRTKHTAAALLEQDTPEVFTTVLGNIPGKTKIKVNLSYITLLRHHFDGGLGTTTLTIPTYITSRYGSPPEDYRDATSTTVPSGLTLNIEVIEAEKVRSIESGSHKIAVERRLGKENADDFADLAGEGDGSRVEVAAVKLASGSAFLDRDFVLDINTEHRSDLEAPQAWLEEHPTMAGHRALMLTLPPKYFGQTSSSSRKKGEILFLADRSGSMEDKIDALKSAMMFFLKGIPEGRKFNIWSFGSTHSSWMPESVQYTDATLDSALSYVNKRFKANKGGTEILPAVKAIVEARDRTMTTDVIILTDGQTWRLEQTLDYIQKQHKRTEGRIRFFSLGIGDGVSHALVEGIAKAGGGYAEVIPASIREGWEDRVVNMLKAALTIGHLGPLYLEFEYQNRKGKTKAWNTTQLPNAHQSPADIATLTPFNHNRVYFLLDSKYAEREVDSVTITAPTGPRTSKTIVIPVFRLEKKDATLHKLAARSILEDLERGKSHLHVGPDRLDPGTREEKALVRQEAESIACKWSLVSKWTSFFLTEEPYKPKGDDLFMDGVIQVGESPGDDLLQPRGGAEFFSRPLEGHLSSASGASAIRRLSSLDSSSTNTPVRIGGLVSPGPGDDGPRKNTSFKRSRSKERRSSPPSLHSPSRADRERRVPPPTTYHSQSSSRRGYTPVAPEFHEWELRQTRSSFSGDRGDETSGVSDSTAPRPESLSYVPDSAKRREIVATGMWKQSQSHEERRGGEPKAHPVEASYYGVHPAQPAYSTAPPPNWYFQATSARWESRSVHVPMAPAGPMMFSAPAPPPPRDHPSGIVARPQSALGFRPAHRPAPGYLVEPQQDGFYEGDSKSPNLNARRSCVVYISDDDPTTEIDGGESSPPEPRGKPKKPPTTWGLSTVAGRETKHNAEIAARSTFAYKDEAKMEKIKAHYEVIEANMKAEHEAAEARLNAEEEREPIKGILKAPAVKRVDGEPSRAEIREKEELDETAERDLISEKPMVRRRACRDADGSSGSDSKFSDTPATVSSAHCHSSRFGMDEEGPGIKLPGEVRAPNVVIIGDDRYRDELQDLREDRRYRSLPLSDEYRAPPHSWGHAEVAGRHKRAHSYYGSGISPSRSDYHDKIRQAAPYQEELDGPAVPLTAETLRRASFGSYDESDYRQSATARTRESATGNEDVTIRMKGAEEDEDVTIVVKRGTKFQLGAAEIQAGTCTDDRVKTDFIRRLVSYQRANGSFDFDSEANEESCLGADVVAKVADLKQILGWDTVRVYVAIVIVLLRRDFKSCRSYWGLMESKAVGYLKSRERALGEIRGSYKDGLAKTKQSLEGATVLLHGSETTGPTSGAASRAVRPHSRIPHELSMETASANNEDEDDEDEESDDAAPRQLVTHAPID